MNDTKTDNVIDFAEFKREMDRMFMNPYERKIDDLLQIIIGQQRNISHLIELFRNTEDRINQISEQLYEMFPDIEIIETMGDDSTERVSMYKDYLNINEDWAIKK